jgi:16S rRNA (adenine1518-N6/adenine1519-N6)-dimethyltransferase
MNSASHRAPLRPRPSRAQGQHFLVQPQTAARIAACARITPHDEVIEIGAGRGALSEHLMRAQPRRLVLVEIDRSLAADLKSRLMSPGIAVVHADFLALELKDLIEDTPVKVVGNLPFNCASAIFQRLGQWRKEIARMVLMFQREVAERIRARPAESAYGALSVLTAIHWEIQEHFRVPAGNFYPQPKVDAEVLVFTPVARPMNETQERVVTDVIKACFFSQRKMLRNALASGLKISPQVAVQRLEQASIDPAARPAQLRLEDFARLARALDGLMPSEGSRADA